MKRVYNIVSIAASVCLLVAVCGCTDNFDDINKDPNVPYQWDQSISIQVAEKFTPMINTIFHSQQNKCQHTEQMVGQYGGHIVCSAAWTTGENFANFNPRRPWNDSPWDDAFTLFYTNYLEVKKLTNSEGYLYHWANIMRVASQHRVADMYGPIPYSDVGSGSLTTKYDDVETVYKTMITELTTSIRVLSGIVDSMSKSTIKAGTYDVVYRANTGEGLAKWVKYANSLKLRLAVRIALVDKQNGSTFATDAIAEVMSDPIGPILNNAENALNSSIPENVTAGYYAATGWGDLRVNATLTTYMNAWNDPRRVKYMKSGTEAGYENYVGVRMGAVIPSNNSRFDYDLDPTVNPATYAIMNVTDPEPVLLFCAAETYFLLAEAAARNWYNGFGTAQELYETGIQKSMEQYGVSMGNYMSEKMTESEGRYFDPYPSETPVTAFDLFAAFSDLDATSTLDVAFPTGGPLEKQIEAIITQKWIANYKLGIEAWSEWRRTGYPRMFPGANDMSEGAVNNPLTGINTGDVRMMRRLKYPNIERNTNSDNYAVALGMLGGPDEFTTELWWAKGNQH